MLDLVFFRSNPDMMLFKGVSHFALVLLSDVLRVFFSASCSLSVDLLAMLHTPKATNKNYQQICIQTGKVHE